MRQFTLYVPKDKGLESDTKNWLRQLGFNYKQIRAIFTEGNFNRCMTVGDQIYDICFKRAWTLTRYMINGYGKPAKALTGYDLLVNALYDVQNKLPLSYFGERFPEELEKFGIKRRDGKRSKLCLMGPKEKNKKYFEDKEIALASSWLFENIAKAYRCESDLNINELILQDGGIEGFVRDRYPAKYKLVLDIVDSGRTKGANGLDIYEVILESQPVELTEEFDVRKILNSRI